MRSEGYVAALAGFAALMVGGIGLGLWWTSGPARLDPARVELPAGELRWVVVGHTGEHTATARQVREAAGIACEAAGGCTAVLLLGEVVPDRVKDAEDPLLEQQIGAWTEVAPVFVVHGDGDLADVRRLGAILTWARAREGVTAPSTTWSATTGRLTLLGLDSTELTAGGPGAEAQQGWIASELAAATTRWRLALSHAPDDGLCGRFNLVFTASPRLAWTRRCGTTWLDLGTGSGDGLLGQDRRASGPPDDVRILHETDQPGFALVEAADRDLRITLVGADAQARFQATLSPDGATRLPDGTLLLQGD